MSGSDDATVIYKPLWKTAKDPRDLYLQMREQVRSRPKQATSETREEREAALNAQLQHFNKLRERVRTLHPKAAEMIGGAVDIAMQRLHANQVAKEIRRKMRARGAPVPDAPRARGAPTPTAPVAASFVPPAPAVASFVPPVPVVAPTPAPAPAPAPAMSVSQLLDNLAANIPGADDEIKAKSSEANLEPAFLAKIDEFTKKDQWDEFIRVCQMGTVLGYYQVMDALVEFLHDSGKKGIRPERYRELDAWYDEECKKRGYNCPMYL